MTATQTKEPATIDIDFTQPSAAVPAPVVPTEQAVATTAPEGETLSQAIIRMASDPRVDIDKLKALLEMQKQLRAEQAELEFNNAMASAQEEMEPIRAASYNEHTKSKYADQAALDRAIRPIYTKHGFSLSMRHGDGAPPEHARILCKLAHRGGHVEWPHYDIPIDGKGARGNDVMTKTHASGASTTYGKRYLLGMIFNLAVSRDDDGNGAGDDDIERLAPKNARRDSTGKLLSTYSADLANKTQKFADEAIQYLNHCNAQMAREWRRDKQTLEKGKRKTALEWLADNSPGQYVRVQQTYQNVTGEDLE